MGLEIVTPQTYINYFQCCIGVSFNSGATPAALDLYGYPIQNFAGNIQYTPSQNGVLATPGPWVLSWPSGRSNFTIELSVPANASNITNCTVNNGSGSGSPQIIGDGVHAGSVTLNFVSTGPPTVTFDGVDTRWGSNTSGVMSMVRQSDVTAFNNGQYWTTEFINAFKNLNPRCVRVMGLCVTRQANVDSNETKWSYRNTTSHFAGVFTPRFAPGAWAGGAGAAGTISVSNGNMTCSPSTDGGTTAWAAGEMLQGIIASNITNMSITNIANNGGNFQLTVSGPGTPTAGLVSTQRVLINGAAVNAANGFTTIASVDSGTTFTINTAFTSASSSAQGFVAYQSLAVTGKTGGAKLVISNIAGAVGFNFETNLPSGNATFTYDAVLDALLYTQGGLWNTIAVEAACQLANNIGCRLWFNVPPWVTDDWVTNALNTIYSNLNGVLELEYCNENWNHTFPPAHWMDTRASVLGIQTNRDYEGLRIRQIHGNLVPASSYGANMSKINRLYMFQAGSGVGDTTAATYYPQGTNLVSPGNSAYQTFVGGSSVNYNIKPNRPVDVVDSMGYAPYFGGIFEDQSGTIGTTYDVAAMQAIIDDTNGGNIAAATAAIDANVREGRNRIFTFPTTVSNSTTTFTTTSAHNYSVGDLLLFRVTGGTAYSNINVQKLYQVLSSGFSTTTFQVGEVLTQSTGDSTTAAVDPGSAGTGTMTVGEMQLGIFRCVERFFAKWEPVIGSYDTDRPTGVPPLKIQWYEGGGDMQVPSGSRCDSLGLQSPNGTPSSGAAASAVLAQSVINWKNDPLSKATYLKYYHAFFGTDSDYSTYGTQYHSVAAADLEILGAIDGISGGEFAACAGGLPATALNPYQWYYGIQAFNNGA